MNKSQWNYEQNFYMNTSTGQVQLWRDDISWKYSIALPWAITKLLLVITLITVKANKCGYHIDNV